MTTAYTSLLGFALPVEGELDGTWGDVVNQNITELVEDSIAATATQSVASGDWTLTTTGSGAVNQARCAILVPTGSPGVTRNIIAPSSSKAYVVDNQSNAAVVVKGSATPGTTIAAGARALVAWTGTDFVTVATSTPDGVTSVSGTGTVQGLTLSGTVTSTGSLTLGGSLSAVSLTSQVSGTLPVANGGTGATDAATARTNLSVPSTTGSGASGTWGINITGNAATATNGVVTTGSYADPAWITSLAGSKITGNISGNAANVTGTVAVANGGTGATTESAARTNLGATTLGGNLFTIANPGAVTFPRFNADNTVSSLDAATFRSAIGAGTSSTTGTVTSVSGTGTVSGLSLSGTVTTSGSLTLGGTLAVTPSNFASQTANTFLAAPDGTSGTSSFRAIVAADIPTLNQNTTGTAANVTGTVGVANGGTGSTTTSGARTNLGATTVGSNLFTLANPSAVTFPRFNADNTVSALSAADFRTAIGAGTGGGSVTSVSGTGSVNGITLTGTVTSSGSLTLGGTLSGVSLTTQVSGTLPVTSGGTGATDTATARANLSVPSTTGSGASGTWGINITGNAATATSATSATTATSATSAASLSTTNFTVAESGGKLVISYLGTPVLSISSTGVLTALSDITANGTV